MKLWIKFLMGALTGILCAFLLPAGNISAENLLNFITEMSIRAGRYMIVPLIFFSAVTAFNRLRETKKLVKTAFWITAVIIVSSLILTLVGLISVLIIKLPRIPITAEIGEDIVSLNIKELFRSIFPYSAFETLNNGTFLPAVFLFAALLGAASSSEPAVFKPVTVLSDSLSKLTYNINVLFTEIFPAAIVFIVCFWTISFRKIILSGVFTPLLLILAADFIITAFIIYPLIIRYLCHDPHPYRILYASICSIIAAFFSGDTNLVLPINIRHGKESLGIRRRINAAVYPLFSVFARGGSALVTTTSFIVIWSSHSSLNIPFSDIIFITFLSFCISFTLGGFPAGGTFVSLTVLCSLYSRGYETAFLLLKPAAPVLCSFAAAYDALTAIFGSYIVAVKTKFIDHHSIKYFI